MSKKQREEKFLKLLSEGWSLSYAKQVSKISNYNYDLLKRNNSFVQDVFEKKSKKYEPTGPIVSDDFIRANTKLNHFVKRHRVETDKTKALIKIFEDDNYLSLLPKGNKN